MQGDLAPEWTHKPTPLPMWCLNAKSRNGNWRLLRSPWEQRAPGHSDRHHRKHTESCRENGVQGQHIFSSFKLVLLRDLMFCVPSGNLLESGSWSKNISNTVSDRDIKHFLNNNVHFCTSSVLRYSRVPGDVSALSIHWIQWMKSALTWLSLPRLHYQGRPDTDCMGTQTCDEWFI